MKWQRNEMRRLDATDDPRPMSVSLRPQNGQLSKKDEKKHGKSCVVKWSAEVCFVLENSTTNCESKAETPTTESTNRKFFFLATKRGYCVLQSVQKEESVSLY